MRTWVICGKNTYTREEKAREILFGTAKPKDFVPAFVFDGIQYFKKIK